ncbi:50S ribosomal protein L6 [Candidatus Microgenomates bacterium]|nr:50S ribosomal protein L6 [Candidatus Microgenomates bacterium]
MSRIGKAPIKIPETVKIKNEDAKLIVSGPKGELTQFLVREIQTKVEGSTLIVSRTSDTARAKSLHGLYRSLINNMVFGVSNGWSKTLELVGVGYKAQLSGNDLLLSLGFSHQIKFPAPTGITFTLNDKEGKIIVSGIDKQLVGETAAKIRRLRPPEPYKGKGIRYSGERIKKKVGKAAKAVGGVAGK